MVNRTTDAQPILSPYPTVGDAEWHALITRGRSLGVLHAEEILQVLRDLELTGDNLIWLHASLGEHGIAIETGEDELFDITPPAGIAKADEADVEAAEGLLRRRERRRSERTAAERSAEGSSPDTVRMYLKEIGRVDLLSPDDERRLAQSIVQATMRRRRSTHSMRRVRSIAASSAA